MKEKTSFWENSNNILGVITVIFVAAAAWVTIWFTQLQHSSRLDKLETSVSNDHDTLLNVSEDIKDIKAFWNIQGRQEAGK